MASQLASPAVTPPRLFRIALIGNPNTGKSTVFNALAGMNARTGNYPGVTVEKKVGRYLQQDQVFELVDLPGTYSLAPRSPDEMVTVDVLTGDAAISEPIDAVLCIVNATLLQRSLFLLSQVLEIGKPVVLLVNMIDVAEARGYTIDATRLSDQLGIPVVLASAAKRRGLNEVREAITRVLTKSDHSLHARPLPERFYQVRDELAATLDGRSPQAMSTARNELPINSDTAPDDYLIERAILDVNGLAEKRLLRLYGSVAEKGIATARETLTRELGSAADIECNARYAWAAERLAGVVNENTPPAATWTDSIDRLLTHRVLGLLFFFLLMFGIFQSIYTLAQYPAGWLEEGQGWISDVVTSMLPAGVLRSLIVDGAIAGVGGVLVFVPQIALLFLFIALLEDCGYMARAAFLVDRVMSFFGLSGKSFLPLMSSFACAIPGVMATRVIENRRDRIATMMIAPLMSCSARLPVYLLMIAAFVPATAYLGGFVTLQALVLMAMYLVGIVVAVPVAWILKKTILRGEASPFVMEMPEYKWPSLPVTLERVYQACKAFVIRAGTLIFCASIVIWATAYFPGDHTRQDELTAQLESLEAEVDTSGEEPTAEVVTQIETLQTELNIESSRLLEESLLGRVGKVIEPTVKPLGWDWKIGVGAIASFPAREVIIATLGTLYSLGGDVAEDDEGLVAAMRNSKWPNGEPVFTVPVALSVMVFFALCAQCVSTLLVIKRETNSWRWPVFSFVYMTVLAYLGALVVYQVGSRI